MNYTHKITRFLLIIFLVISCKPKRNSTDLKNYNQSLSELVSTMNLQKEDLSILINKSDYTLTILANDKIVKVYPVVLGTNPVDDKLMEGDRSTPEGDFKVRDYYPHKNWSKFIWIDYPTRNSWNKHNKAKSANKIPQNATIGGEIGIHGVPQGKDDLISQKVNWTWGCISLTNDDVNEIYQVIYKNMEIRIVK